MKNPCLTHSFHNHVRDILKAAFYGLLGILIHLCSLFIFFLPSCFVLSLQFVWLLRALSVHPLVFLVSYSWYNHWSDYPVARPWLHVLHYAKLVPSGTVIPMVDALEQKHVVIHLCRIIDFWGQPVPHFTTSWMKNFSLTSNWNLPSFSLKPFPLGNRCNGKTWNMFCLPSIQNISGGKGG